jgi:hypothetical protein
MELLQGCELPILARAKPNGPQSVAGTQCRDRFGCACTTRSFSGMSLKSRL